MAGDPVALAPMRGDGTLVGRDTGAGSRESNRELSVVGRRDGAWKVGR